MDCKHFDQAISGMLQNKSVHLNVELRNHLNLCKHCWKNFLSARWKIANDSREISELRAFLGDDFLYGCDSSWKLANEWNCKDRKTNEDIAEFYRNTPWYIYNLTLWYSSGQRPKYCHMCLPILNELNVRSILDFGAGVGTDALEFASLGFNVESYEINILCNQFIKWRKKLRDIEISVCEKTSDIAQSFDLLWVIDLIEHLKDPVEVLGPFLERCKVFIYDTEYGGNSGGRHPFHFSHNNYTLQQSWKRLGFTPLKNASKRIGINILAR